MTDDWRRRDWTVEATMGRFLVLTDDWRGRDWTVEQTTGKFLVLTDDWRGPGNVIGTSSNVM